MKAVHHRLLQLVKKYFFLQGISLPISNNPNTPSHNWCVWFCLSAVCLHSSALYPSMNTCDRSSPGCKDSKYWSKFRVVQRHVLQQRVEKLEFMLPRLSHSTFSARAVPNKCFLFPFQIKSVAFLQFTYRRLIRYWVGEGRRKTEYHWASVCPHAKFPSSKINSGSEI